MRHDQKPWLRVGVLFLTICFHAAAFAGETNTREFNGYLQTGRFFSKTGDEVVLFLDSSRSSSDISQDEDKVADKLLAAIAINAADVAGLASSMYEFSKGFGTSIIKDKSAADMLHIVVLPREGLVVGGPVKSPARFSPGTIKELSVLTKTFGPPSERESWPGKLPSNLVISSSVLWWGKVGVAHGKDGHITHVLLRAPVQLSKTPASSRTDKSSFQTPPGWPVMSVELKGTREVRIKNPNPFSVRAALRSGVKGKDLTVPANGTTSALVPDGKYDIFFHYSTDPAGLYQGDSFQLKGNGVEIQIVKVVGGNFGIRKVR